VSQILHLSLLRSDSYCSPRYYLIRICFLGLIKGAGPCCHRVALMLPRTWNGLSVSGLRTDFHATVSSIMPDPYTRTFVFLITALIAHCLMQHSQAVVSGVRRLSPVHGTMHDAPEKRILAQRSHRLNSNNSSLIFLLLFVLHSRVASIRQLLFPLIS
jgi:hypothetical protein